MTRKAQLRLDNALWGVLLGSVLLVVFFCLMVLGSNGPGGGSADGIRGVAAWVGMLFLKPAFWVSELLWDDNLTFWRGLAVFWPYSILASWATVVLCRKFAAKWREC